jgi:acyl dehydratase
MTESGDGAPTVGLGLYWEDTPVGFRFRTVGRTITDADITNFVGVTGMTEVLFTNLEYLRNESLFEGRLVPGGVGIFVCRRASHAVGRAGRRSCIYGS